METYLLTIGSNSPLAQMRMSMAETWLAEHFRVKTTSGIYSSAALNGVSPDYLNMVVRVESDFSLGDVIAMGKAFERECGRTAGSKSCGCVEMDVDVVQAGNVIIRPAEFTRAYFLKGYSKVAIDEG